MNPNGQFGGGWLDCDIDELYRFTHAVADMLLYELVVSRTVRECKNIPMIQW